MICIFSDALLTMPENIQPVCSETETTDSLADIRIFSDLFPRMRGDMILIQQYPNSAIHVTDPITATWVEKFRIGSLVPCRVNPALY